MKNPKPKQSIPGKERYTIADFNTQFPNEDACLTYVLEERWPDGRVHCEKCKTVRKHHRVSKRTAYACDYCGNHIYPLAGTIFEKSTTRLKTWFYAMYLMSSTRCGISAKQIQRETGVTYKTAWRMFKQIRTLMSEDISLEGEAVECDETYVGGKAINMHRDVKKRRNIRAGGGGKTTVFGMVERGGSVIAKVIPDGKVKSIFPVIQERVLPSSTIYTDEYILYEKLADLPQNYTHRRINHAQKIYVMGQTHTNTIEGFWSLLKRGLGGVYHSVSSKHLQSYCDEYSFRYNRRSAGVPMFTSLLEQVALKAE
jgi:transposase-like protein